MPRIERIQTVATVVVVENVCVVRRSSLKILDFIRNRRKSSLDLPGCVARTYENINNGTINAM